MTEIEKLIQELDLKLPNKYYIHQLEGIAQFIIEDRKRIFNNLIELKSLNYDVDTPTLEAEIDNALKLAGLGDEK
jgi:hypothetical protein